MVPQDCSSPEGLVYFPHVLARDCVLGTEGTCMCRDDSKKQGLCSLEAQSLTVDTDMKQVKDCKKHHDEKGYGSMGENKGRPLSSGVPG